MNGEIGSTRVVKVHASWPGQLIITKMARTQQIELVEIVEHNKLVGYL